MMAIKVLNVREDILGENEKKAKENHEFLNKEGILMVNLMSSPGSGKTSLLLKTIKNMKGKARIGVIEGDIASTVDAEKIKEMSAPVLQINTGGGCHLEAIMIDEAFQNLPMKDIDILFIENVGNLVCPAEFYLGEQKRAMILSLPEGHDKPFKYPLMFTDANVVLINKMDLAPLLDFDMDVFKETVKGLNPDVEFIEISCTKDQGLDAWYSWLEKELKNLRAK
jgi:hydrogenase nickel incorporation protein HypB